MELKELIKNLARALKKNRIKYMIIGGQAVLIYGEPRMTKDIDITIGLDISGLEKLKKIIKELNLKSNNFDDFHKYRFYDGIKLEMFNDFVS